MIKRLSLFLLLFCILISLVFANSQKIYTTSSEIYRTVYSLCKLYGVAGPSDASPISGDELIIALDRIDVEKLSQKDREEYSKVRDIIENKNSDVFRFDSTLIVSPEIYLQSAEDKTITTRDWDVQYKDRLDILKLPMEIYVSDYLYGGVSFGLREQLVDGNSAHFSKQFHYNIPMLNGSLGIQRSIPDVAGISLGSDYSHLYIGRNRQSIGSGKSGNLMVGDNFYYQNFGKFTIHTNPFTYNLSITYFDRQRSTAISDYSSNSGRKGGTQLENFGFSGPHQVRVIHNYQATFFDKLVVSLNFGNLFDTDNALDLRMLNPFMFMHNYFNYTEYNENYYGNGAKIEANNHFSLAVSYTFLPSWNIYLELMVDQFQLPGEKTSGKKEPPNALGALFNISHTARIGDGFLNSYAEVVYTSPNLYLNEKYTNEDGSTISHSREDGLDYYYWNQDLIVGNSIWWANDISYSGYLYGPDTILAEIGSEYESSIFSVGAKIRYKAHGEQGIRFTKNQNQTLYYPESAWDLGLTGTVEHAFSFIVNGRWNIIPAIALKGSASYHLIANYRNVADVTSHNMQLTMGIEIIVW